MGQVVFHLDKSPGNEAAMTEHIERKVIHPNVDPSRVHLNKELIQFPEGVNDRTEAIRHRLQTAGLGRQIGKNQVQVIRFILSGTPEDRQRIQSEGRLDEWCRDNMDYLKKTYRGKCSNCCSAFGRNYSTYSCLCRSDCQRRTKKKRK